MPTTVTLSISLSNPDDLTDADKAAIVSELSDLSAIIDDVVVPFAQEQEREAFASEGGSIGEVWAPWADSTRRRKAANLYGDVLVGTPSRLLVDSGRLEANIGTAVDVTDTSATVGVDSGAVPYARAQNEGNPGTNLPPRVFMRFTADDIDTLIQRVEDAIALRAGVPIGSIVVSVA